jgi:superfamily II DNA or RNA helicase
MKLVEANREIAKSVSWKDLNSKLEKLAKSDQAKFAGDIFELISKYFLKTDSKYRSIFKNVWLLDEVPETIKLKLNLPDQDEGIDIIAETKNEKYWAIQSKYRSNPEENLTLGGRGGLATFSSLAFTYCKNISHGIVITTVNKPPKKINLINDIGFETLESFLALDDNQNEGWKILQSCLLNKIIKPEKLYPKPHQIEGINKAINYLKFHDRGKIIMPCGTGKSLLGYWLAKEMKAKSILIAVPSLALIQQTLKTWTREITINDLNADWLCVCSDNTVKDDQDSFVSFTYDLGIQVTTNEDDIRKFLNRKTSNYKIIFTTYFSGKVIANASKNFNYDLAIMDEAHKTVGHFDKLTAHLMHQKNINIKKRVFMTATERLFRANPNEYLSMNSKKDYGDVIFDLSFKKAIKARPPIISDYKIITFNVTDSDIEKIHNDNKFIRVEKELENITAREFATAIALRKAIKSLDIKNAISFHSSIKRAKNFQKQQEIIDDVYPEYNKLKTFHVSGDMPVSKRASQMRLFAEGNGLMTNARCLTEGVDLPAIDCVCFTDPKRSKVDIVQAAGRALRLSKNTNKKFGYILVPLFVSENSSPELASKGKPFEEIISIIGALSTQDSRISEYLKAVTMGRKPAVGKKTDGIISINTLTQIDPDKFEKAILIKVWDKIARVNYLTYQEVKKYAQSLNLNSSKEWNEISVTNNFPKDIPRNVSLVYSDEFEGWGKFLGTGKIATMDRVFMSYQDAKNYAKSLNLSSQKEWAKHWRESDTSDNLPSSPHVIYKEEFEGWGEFLGTGNLPPPIRKMKSYEDAKKFVHKLKLKNTREYIEAYKNKKLSEDIPRHPDRKYKNEFKNWGEFLGTGTIAPQSMQFRSFEESKKYAKSLNFKTRQEWFDHIKTKGIPKDIPKAPSHVYNEFVGWGDFLDSGKIGHKHKFISYKEAKKYALSLNLKSLDEWFEHCRSKNFSKNIPINVHQYYSDEFEGIGLFLGTNKIGNKRSYRSYQEAKKFAHSLNLKNQSEWNDLRKRKKLPVDIPGNPSKEYKDEYEGLSIFLGYKNDDN